MYDCTVGLKLRVMARILPFFYPFFYLSQYCMLKLKHCVRVFSGTIVARILKLCIFTWTMSCCIVGLKIRLLALILSFIYLFSVF